MALNTPILTQIETKMKELIESMTPGAYHYKWTVNGPDRSKVEFPLANIYLESDNTQDTIGGSSNQEYTHVSVYRIDVTTKLEQEMSNPQFDINVDLNKCFDDLLKIFGVYPTLQGKADTIMYLSATREFSKTGDIMIPAKMITRWRIEWESSRVEPSHVVL